MGQMVRENIKLLTKFKNTSPKYLFYKRQAVSLVNHACELVYCCSFIMPFFQSDIYVARLYIGQEH